MQHLGCFSRTAFFRVAVCTPSVAVADPHANLFNCAVVLHRGRVLCVVPKTYLPNYREFYEKRYFVSATAARQSTIRIDDREVSFGADLLFEVAEIADCVLHVESP